MSFLAVAVVGGAVVSGYVANKAGKRASEASAAGAASAADATIESTRMQIEEISRQFDYQQQVLQPFVQNQQRAAQAYSNLLGYSSERLPPSGGAASLPGQQTTSRATDMMFRPGAGSQARDAMFRPGRDQIQGKAFDANAPSRSGGVTIDGATGQPIGRNGQPFRDPNVNYFAMGRGSSADTELGRSVRDNRLAGSTAAGDELVDYVGRTGLAGGAAEDSAIGRADDVRLAAPGGYTNDPRFQFARDTAVVGDSFTESPGYAFQVEEMQRQVDRKNSAGGNYGGRALMEAQRRAQGVAAGDYYNWVGARHADLGRQDTALASYQDREVMDVGRGDAALGDYRRREELDLARGDAAYENFLGRRATDVQRGDAAVLNNQQLQQYDLQRQDQAYYNYLASLGGAAGLNIGAPQAVASSAQAGAQISGAYAQQGGRLSSIYSQRGQDEANIQLGRAANINSAIQSGIGNYLTYQGYNQPGAY